MHQRRSIDHRESDRCLRLDEMDDVDILGKQLQPLGKSSAGEQALGMQQSFATCLCASGRVDWNNLDVQVGWKIPERCIADIRRQHSIIHAVSFQASQQANCAPGGGGALGQWRKRQDDEDSQDCESMAQC